MKLLKDLGFTLVELMVVVAIIGILSAIAIPNFKQYQAKSKTSEAKLQLASLYTAETSFAADFDTFASCLLDMGYSPGGDATNTFNQDQRYYTVGFKAASGIADDINGSTCTQGNNFVYTAGKKVGGATSDNTHLNDATNGDAAVATAGDTFVAGAAGIIDANKTAAGDSDYWTVDQDKTIIQQRKGF